jgi:hypothetical protein
MELLKTHSLGNMGKMAAKVAAIPAAAAAVGVAVTAGVAAAPHIILSIAATALLAKWAYDVYKQS